MTRPCTRERVTLGGLFGTVVEVRDDGVIFEWDAKVQLTSAGISARRWFLDWPKYDALTRKSLAEIQLAATEWRGSRIDMRPKNLTSAEAGAAADALSQRTKDATGTTVPSWPVNPEFYSKTAKDLAH